MNRQQTDVIRDLQQLANTRNLHTHRESVQRLKRMQGDLAALLHDKWDSNYHPQEIKLAIQHGKNRLEHGDSIDKAAESARYFINNSDLSTH